MDMSQVRSISKSLSLLGVWVASLAILCALVSPAHSASMLSSKRVLVLGDSITQQGHYVTDLEYYLDKADPAAKPDIISVGLSSETVSGLSEHGPYPRPYLHERLWAALDLVKPDVVFACYGMNDGIYQPQSPEHMQAFQTGILKLIAETKAAGAKLILLTPTPFDPTVRKRPSRPITNAADYTFSNPYEKYDDVLSDYAKWEMTLASSDVQVIDLHTPLAQFLADKRKSDPAYKITADGVHPTPVAHLLMAETVLNAIGVPTSIGNLDDELAKDSADPLFILVQKHRETRSKGWLPYIGYTRNSVFKTSTIDDTERQAAELQHQIDALQGVK